jgi:CelD/BcsL family acetyltransferase involved in cellulose biosynthesis
MMSALRAEMSTTAPGTDEWQDLTNGLITENRFLTADWVDYWSKSFLPYQNWRPPLRYLTVRAAGAQLIAVFPFATQKQAGIPVASLGGYYWPFRSVVIDRRRAAEAAESLVHAFTQSGTTLAVRYGPVPAIDPAIAALNAAFKGAGWRVHCVKLGDTLSLDLPKTWEEFERNLSPNLRANAKYYERKMQREGPFEIRRITNTVASNWAQALDHLAAVEERSWQRSEGGQLRFLGPDNQSFWKRLLTESGFADMVSVWFIYFNGEPVSFCFCLDCADTRHIIANNYVTHIHKYSTGTILYRHVFRDAIESGIIRRVNIGLGDSGYKSRWGAKPSFPLLDWIVFRPGSRGRLLDWAYRTRSRLSKLKQDSAKRDPDELSTPSH